MMTETLAAITLMGSGEMGEAMARVHRRLLASLEGPARAVFVDTPAGFELNVDEISERATDYFRQRFNLELQVVSFKNKEKAPAAQVQAALASLIHANYIFAGPGSPSYAIDNWNGTPVWNAIVSRWREGAQLVLASAAAITTGYYALPVYEIYKAGQDPHWIRGLDLFGSLGLKAAIVPHWNNTEGGTYDTRFCFMGAPRFEVLASQTDPEAIILGIDENTALTIDPQSEMCSVSGVGQVTRWANGRERAFASGAVFSIRDLAVESGAAFAIHAETEREQAEAPSGTGVLTSSAGQYLHHLAHALDLASEGEAQRELIEQAHGAVHALVGESLQDTTIDTDRETVSLVVDLLVELREKLRANKQYALADRLREDLLRLGFELRDTTGRTVWNRVQPGGSDAARE